MKIYVVWKDFQPTHAYWSEERALQMAQRDRGTWPITTVELEPLKAVIDRYYQFRELEPPNTLEALAFLTSELGEFADAVVSGEGNWTRNNPDKDRDAGAEAADTLMMLYVTAGNFLVDPITEMLAKFWRKGFTDEPPETPGG